ncbi:hypothetical protein HCTV5_18 [Halovirus HCTV-5]|uniref:hypothetical protein n=1 Tax=Halovirus HCTV-5 TaxID=1273748 RepID=UPI0003348233|nr:hypothetical protein M200_gp018 [Halovirus HCTV-5]AGM11629.1 hypothetical protein HCTV5_18 [Halovirus HCTV-5]
MTDSTYTVWKIGTNGEYSRLVKAYKTERGAKSRADSEAEDEWRSGVMYVVTSGTGRPCNFEDGPASRVGMDGIEYNGVGVYEVSA